MKVVVLRDSTPWLEVELGRAGRELSVSLERDGPRTYELRSPGGALVGSVRRVAAPIDPLTRREAHVLSFLARGYTNRELAERLGISTRTAETHRAQIAGKLGLTRRSELVSWALERGLVDVFP